MCTLITDHHQSFPGSHHPKHATLPSPAPRCGFRYLYNPLASERPTRSSRPAAARTDRDPGPSSCARARTSTTSPNAEGAGPCTTPSSQDAAAGCRPFHRPWLYHSLARSTICPRCACGCVPPGCGRAPGRARPWAGTFLLRCRLCVDSSTCATLASGKEAEIDIEKHGPGPD